MNEMCCSGGILECWKMPKSLNKCNTPIRRVLAEMTNDR